MTDPDAVVEALPKHFEVSVVLECRDSSVNRWVDKVWSAVGVIVDKQNEAATDEPVPLYIDDKGRGQYRWGWLSVRLYRDETESYYQNLMADDPGLFVICRDDEQSRPRPFLVSASFDEANSYMETDERVFKVPIPQALYRWIEAFVVAYHLPQPIKKRRRKPWSEAQKP